MITVQNRLEEIKNILNDRHIPTDSITNALTQLYQECRSNAFHSSEDLLSSIILKALISRTDARPLPVIFMKTIPKLPNWIHLIF